MATGIDVEAAVKNLKQHFKKGTVVSYLQMLQRRASYHAKALEKDIKTLDGTIKLYVDPASALPKEKRTRRRLIDPTRVMRIPKYNINM